MFVILTYDINAKRVGKALKLCRRYLIRVQNSVFEGNVTDKQLADIKKGFEKIMDPEHDSVRIYELSAIKYTKLELIGKCIVHECII